MKQHTHTHTHTDTHSFVLSGETFQCLNIFNFSRYTTKVFHTKDKCSRRPSSNLYVWLALTLNVYVSVCVCVCFYYDIWSMGTRVKEPMPHTNTHTQTQRGGQSGTFAPHLLSNCMQYSSIKCISFIYCISCFYSFASGFYKIFRWPAAPLHPHISLFTIYVNNTSRFYLVYGLCKRATANQLPQGSGVRVFDMH